MKPLLALLILVGLTLWGHFAVPHFDSYMIMIALISVLVIAHEFGHFWVAKRVGVKVERFGFGLPFGPVLLEKQIGGTKFCLHPVLLGGYVSFPDDDPESGVPQDSPLRFENKKLWERAAIAIAGVTVNFLLGYFILVGVFAIWGYPPQVVGVGQIMSKMSPAAQAGLMPGDIILKVAEQKLSHSKDLIQYFQAHRLQPTPLVIDRKGKEKHLTVTPNAQGRIEARVGDAQIMDASRFERLSNPFQSLTLAYTFLSEKMVMNFQGMGEVFTGKRSVKELSGPVGIIQQGGDAIHQQGLAVGLILTALISTILAIMNILPIPMLDGGHLLFMAIEVIQGHPLKKEIQERVIQVSFAALVGLMGFVLWNDINTHLLGR